MLSIKNEVPYEVPFKNMDHKNNSDVRFMFLKYKRLKNKIENNPIREGRFIKVNELKLTHIELF